MNKQRWKVNIHLRKSWLIYFDKRCIADEKAKNAVGETYLAAQWLTVCAESAEGTV